MCHNKPISLPKDISIFSINIIIHLHVYQRKTNAKVCTFVVVESVTSLDSNVLHSKKNKLFETLVVIFGNLRLLLLFVVY